MSHTPLEARLRPPVEWWSSLTCGLLGAASLLMPNHLLLTEGQGLTLSAILLPLSAWRWWCGYRVYHYQRHLQQLPHYAIASKTIPHKPGQLFLGRGFRWEAKHTQRVYDCREQGLEVLATPVHSTVGGSPLFHGVEPNEQEVWLPLSDRVGHTLVLGTTRVGKTRLLELLVSQDIERGDTVIVFDPKGDAELLRRIVFEAKRAKREADLVIFHLGFPNHSARYNPIGHFARVTEVANRLANQLPNSGESAAFKEFSWRFVNIVAQALVLLGERPDYRNVHRYILDFYSLLERYAEFRLNEWDANWQAQVEILFQKRLGEKSVKSTTRQQMRVEAICDYLDQKQYIDPVLAALRSACQYDRTYYDKITASLLPLLEKLTTGQSAALISPDYADVDDTRAVFDWMQVIRGQKIVYVGLDALSDSTVAGAVGNSMFSDLCSVAGQLYKYGVSANITTENAPKKLHPICVHADEFNELIGNDFIPLLNKAGGAGVQVTAYTQTWSDVEAELVSKAKAGQVGGNLNTVICLRVLDEETAKMFTQKLPQRVTLKSLIQVSGVSDTPGATQDATFTSSNEDRVHTIEAPLLMPDDLIQLPKGQAFALLNGGSLYKLRIPLPSDDMSNIPEHIAQMAQVMQQQQLFRGAA